MINNNSMHIEPITILDAAPKMKPGPSPLHFMANGVVAHKRMMLMYASAIRIL
jgi:hypothetical protein